LYNWRPIVIALRWRPMAVVCRRRASNGIDSRIMAWVVAIIVSAWWRARVVAYGTAAVALFWAVGLLL
jgi:hypothetical protein